jgi:hypothetical protein
MSVVARAKEQQVAQQQAVNSAADSNFQCKSFIPLLWLAGAASQTNPTLSSGSVSPKLTGIDRYF